MGLFAPLQRSRFDPERRMFDGEAGEAASKRHTPSPKPLGERRPRGGLGEEDLIPDGYTTGTLLSQFTVRDRLPFPCAVRRSVECGGKLVT